MFLFGALDVFHFFYLLCSCFCAQVSLDSEHKFDLALELGKLESARGILDDMPKEEYDTTDAQSKWKRLGDLALAKYVARMCFFFRVGGGGGW